MNVRVPVELRDRIDKVRGVTSRDAWVQQACELALKPTVAARNPELRPAVHTHSPGLPLRTEFVKGVKVRVFSCGDPSCEIEVREIVVAP